MLLDKVISIFFKEHNAQGLCFSSLFDYIKNPLNDNILPLALIVLYKPQINDFEDFMKKNSPHLNKLNEFIKNQLKIEKNVCKIYEEANKLDNDKMNISLFESLNKTIEEKLKILLNNS